MKTTIMQKTDAINNPNKYPLVMRSVVDDGRVTKCRIEYSSAVDQFGKRTFTLFWLADYHPGHPKGEHQCAERGQGYYGIPEEHVIISSNE